MTRLSEIQSHIARMDELLGIGGSSNVTVPCAVSAGGVYDGATLTLTQCTSATQYANAAPDPYASLPAPSISGACTTVPATGNLSPGTYCGGLSIKDTRTFNSGTYVIDGGTFQLNANAVVSGTNLLFYLTNGATLSFNGNASINFSANTSGTYSGVLFFGDRTMAMATQTINGTSTSQLTGAIYFPSQTVQWNGNFSGQNGCLQIIADQVTISGNVTMGINCTAYGMNTVPIPAAATLVE